MNFRIMDYDFPNEHEKKCMLRMLRKKNYLIFLLTKISYMFPKLNDAFSLLFFELRRLKLLKLNFFRHTPDIIPNFMVIGFPKAGTTSIHEYLSQHPQISGSWIKETHYFSYGYEKSKSFYNKNFHKIKNSTLYFESSPEYIYYTDALERIKKINPKIKFIVCLRNPVSLIFSNYNQELEMGLETEPIENVLLKENYKSELHKKRLEKKIYSISKRPLFLPYLYITEYVTYIKNAFKIFPKEQFLFINSTDLENNTQKIVDQVFEFLGLPHHNIVIKFHNKGNYKKEFSSQTSEKLSLYFKPFNDELERLLNRKFDWT